MRYGQFFKIKQDLIANKTAQCVDIFMRSGDTFREINIEAATILDVHGPGANAPETLKTEIQSGVAYLSIDNIVALVGKVPEQQEEESPYKARR